MIVRHQQIRHREQRRVHNASRPTEYNHTDSGPGQCHQRHAGAVKQQTTHINGSRPESGDQSLDHQRIAGARQRVHGHAPAAESDAFLVAQLRQAARQCGRITAEHCLAHEVGKVQGVANVRHPAEQIRQTDHAHRVRHMHD